MANRPANQAPETSSELAISARNAGLHYVTDRRPGIARAHSRRGAFDYFDPHGRRIRETTSLERIKRLAIPPAWRDVWICPDGSGHLQATGRDARGRKQYRYHSGWRRIRDETKYDRVIGFGRALQKVRRRVARDLTRRGLPREKVLATIVRLLETTLIRVGNDEYARDNKSYGLTTLQDRHTEIRSGKVTFKFRGKSGKQHVFDIRNRKLANIVKRCRDLPGYELFQYIDESGSSRGHHLQRCKCLPARNLGRGFYRKGLSHLGGNGVGSKGVAGVREIYLSNRSQEKSLASGRSSCADARKYPRHLPEVLRSPRGP